MGTTLNILGSCICRDIFGLADTEKKYEIKTFMQASSPAVIFDKNMEPPEKISAADLDKISSLSKFQKKCILADYNKTVLDYFVEKTDYFVLDLCEFGGFDFAVQKFDDGAEHYFSKTKWFLNAYRDGLSEKIGGTLRYISKFDVCDDKYIDSVLDRYVDWLKGKLGYREEQIIIVENYYVGTYIDNGKIGYFWNTEKNRTRVNELLAKMYGSLEKKLSCARVIRMPFHVSADKAHRWGLAELHYVMDYYRYVYECVVSITEKSFENLSVLRERYSRKFQEQMIRCFMNDFRDLQVSGNNLLKPFTGALDSYIAMPGTQFINADTGKTGELKAVYQIHQRKGLRSYIKDNAYVKTQDCVKGCAGESQTVFAGWETANICTVVEAGVNGAIIISHNEVQSRAQANFIYIVPPEKRLAGKTICFSVYARCLEFSDTGKGGQIGIINDTGYGGGKFLSSNLVADREWKQIVVSCPLPGQDILKGVTVCLRAMSGKQKHARVEFMLPKLEIGYFPTGM